MPEGARQAAPGGTAVVRARLEDWILATVFVLFPLLGLIAGRGDGFALAGVGILLCVGERAPIPRGAREALQASGIAVLLVVLCLLLPQLEAPAEHLAFPSFEVARLIRLALAAVLLSALVRGGLPHRPWMRSTDLAALGALLGAGIVTLALWRSGARTAALVLGETALSLGIVFGVHRVHLVRSQALPFLTRAALVGVAGALLVAALG